VQTKQAHSFYISKSLYSKARAADYLGFGLLTREQRSYLELRRFATCEES
jgi:hypothetical protein